MARQTFNGLRLAIFESGVEVFKVEEAMEKPRSWLSRVLNADPEGNPSQTFCRTVMDALAKAKES